MSKQRSREGARRPYRRRARSARLQLPRYYTVEGGWHTLYPPDWITAPDSWLTHWRRVAIVAAMLALMGLVAFFILLGGT